MLLRWVAAFLSMVLGALLMVAPAIAQSRTDHRQNPPDFSSGPFDDPSAGGFGSGRITGTVRTLDGHVVSNANIQARGVGRTSAFLSARSDSNGSFALYNISPGTYEVTASAGNDEAHEQVEINSISSDASIDFRLRNKAEGSVPGSGSTVSISQLSVPTKARALYEKALQSKAHAKPDDALSKVNAALAICPKFPEALTLRGMLEEDAGKRDEAVADFRQAIQHDGNYVRAYLALASLYNSTGRFNESSLILGRAEPLAPNAWQMYFELARANIGKGKYAEALRNIDRSSELQGGPQKEVPELHLIRGYALIGLTEISRATQEFEMFLARQPHGELADSTRKVLDQLHATTLDASK